jgi:hypothetical protein
MDVLSLLRLIARHWRVAAPAALLTLVGLVVVFQVSAPTYKATGSIVLLNPRQAPDIGDNPEASPEVGQNPFARYNDIAVVTDILTRIMNSDSKHDELASQGVPGYDIVANALQHDPVFEVMGHGPDAETAIQSAEIVLKEAQTVLSEVQVDQGADPEYLISSVPLTPPSTATALYSSTTRAAVAALAVGGLGTLGLAVLAEFIGQRRAARRPPSRWGAVESDATGGVVEAAGSNGSPVRGAVDPDAADEVVDAAGSNGSPVPSSGARADVRRSLGALGSNGSFNSAGIVPEESPADASNTSPADDHGDPSTFDR